MKVLLASLLISFFAPAAAQTCFTISGRTNGNGNSNTCGASCSGNAKTGHIDISFGASCPGVIPALELITVSTGAPPSPFCFDAGNCISAGTVRYCFRGNNLPSAGFMTLRFTQNSAVWSCSYSVNGGSGTILPVQLSMFDARLQANRVHLKWETTQEINSDYFNIERSTDNRTFTVIGNVKAQGNSYSTVNYEFIDPAPFKGINFYRLKEADIDNKTNYSAIRRIDFRNPGIQIQQLYPNPVSDNVTLRLQNEKATSLTIVVVNSYGQVVTREYKHLLAGAQKIEVELANLASGIYELVLTTGSGVVLSEKIVKQ